MADRWQWCKTLGCSTKIIFARRPGSSTPVPYEFDDRETFSDHAAGADVIIAGEAWRPGDAVEDFRVRFGITEEAARKVVSGYPSHRAHTHDPDEAIAGREPSDDVAAITDLVCRTVQDSRFRYADEGELQEGLSRAFSQAGLPFQREARLTPSERIDFLVQRVGVEVKVAGSVENVTRQLMRYAESPRVAEQVLVTTKARHREVPQMVGGKPCTVVLVRGNAW